MNIFQNKFYYLFFILVLYITGCTNYDPWINEGFTLKEADQWIELKFHPKEASEWKDEGFSITESLEWKAM